MFARISCFLPSFSRRRGPLRRRRCAARFESLECRQLLAGDLAITEFMASNAQTLADEDGQFKDWIEVHNQSDQALDLVGWSLTDDPSQLGRWQFPFQSVEAGAYLLVFASGKARAADNVSLTRDFNATADGTFLVDLADGLYNVRLTMGDRDRVRDNVTVSLQDTVVDTINTAAGEFAIGNYSVQVDGGQLRLRLQDNGGETARATINALLVTPADGGEPQWFDFGRIDSPVEPRFSIVSELHAYQAGRHYGWQDVTTVVSQDRGPAGETQLHTNFKLAAGGEYVALVSPDGQIVSEYGPGGTDYPAQNVDISYGLAPNGEVAFLEPTPGAPNQAIALANALPVEFSVPRGFYTEPFPLQLTAGTEGAVLRYTTDGSDPTAANGTVYQDPITVSGTTTLRAAAFKDGFAPSVVTTHTYLFLEDVLQQSPAGAAPVGFPSAPINGQGFDYGMDPDIVGDPNWGPEVLAALTALPTLSLVTDLANLFDPQTGIYVHAGSRGKDWERAGSLELLNPDGSLGFQTDTGIRIRGGFSRTGGNPKHAFRLFFRDEYSGDLTFPLFGTEGADHFKKVDLRTTQNYSWAFQGDRRNTFLRDIFSRDTQRDMGHPYTRGRYYHLYINGQYWGMYQTDERPEAAYAETYFGGDRADYDVVKPNPDRVMEATDGNLDAYLRLHQASVEGFEDDAAYFRVQGMNPDGTRNPDFERLLDADNLIDYMLITYYTGDRDGPGSRFTSPNPNNFFGIYDRENPDGFKWFEHDSEHSLGTGDNNMISPLYTERSSAKFDDSVAARFNPHWLHEILMRNATYRQRFADRLVQHTAPGGALSESAALARLDFRADQIRDAMAAESARWGDAKRDEPLTPNDWAAEVESIKNWISTRNSILFAQLRSQGWLSDVPVPLVNSDVAAGAPAAAVSVTTPEGTSFFTTDGSDPRLANGQVSPQARASNRIETFVAETTSSRYRIPTGAAAEQGWQATTFDDSNWAPALGPIGFDTGQIEDDLSVPAGFTVAVAGSTEPVASLAAAETLLAAANVEQFDGVPVIDFSTAAEEGHFAGGQAFLGSAADYVAMRATATLVVARSGTYTFGLNSGGGSRLRIDGADLIVNEVTAEPFDRFAWLELGPGSHQVDLELFYEGAGSVVELAAAPRALSKLTGAFRLLGALDQQPFGPIITTDVEASMSGVNSSIYVRYPFELDQVGDVEQLFLNVRYDDGLVAFLNGAEVARRNAPFTLGPSSTATVTRADTAAVTQEWIDITPFQQLLVEGDNVLAVQGLNRAADNPDFLLGASLGVAIADDPLVVTEPTIIKARAFRNGQWSPLREKLIPVGGPVRVTEVHYNPAAPTAAELAVNPGFIRTDFEFIELKNTGDQAADISGLAFDRGVKFSFAQSDITSLEAGAFAVVVRNREAFETRYGTAIPIAGQFAGSNLADAGETVRLEGLFDTEIHEFTYDDTGAWPARAGGFGSSLEVLDTAGDYRDASNWRASAEFGGSPGRDGATAAADILVNELLATPAGFGPDRIELLNRADHAIDLAGWTLTDDLGQLAKFSLPAETILAPGSYLELTSSQTGFDLDGHNGGELWLVETDSGAPVRFADHVLFDGTDAGVALGRWPDGDPGGMLFPMTEPTFGAKNARPLVGDVVVSEIHYQPSQLGFQADFATGSANGFSERLGDWTVSDGFYKVLPGPEQDTAALIPSVTGLPRDFVVSTTIRLPFATEFKANAAIIFDYVDPTNFKFASIHARTGRWRLGQRDATKWNFLITAERPFFRGADIKVSVEITGTVATLLSNGIVQTRYDFGVPLNGGQVGIGSRNGEAKFGQVAVEPLGDQNVFEFVELANTTAAAVDLGGWQLRQAVAMTFPAGTEIGPGEALVAVAFDPSDEAAAAAFRDRFEVPESVLLVGPYSGQLDDAGDLVQLVKPQLQDPALAAPVLVDAVAYLDQPPWPDATGSGQSLARARPAAFGNFAASWAALDPTPGAAVFARLGDLNRDGVVAADDIGDLVLALRQPAAYEAKHGVAAAFQADLDGDGDLDFDDISRFLALLDEPARVATAAVHAAAAGSGARNGADPGNRADKRGPRH